MNLKPKTKFYENECFYKDRNLTNEKMEQTLRLASNKDCFAELVQYIADNRYDLQRQYGWLCNNSKDITHIRSDVFARIIMFLCRSIDYLNNDYSKNVESTDKVDITIVDILEKIEDEMYNARNKQIKIDIEDRGKKKLTFSEARYFEGAQFVLDRLKEELSKTL